MSADEAFASCVTRQVARWGHSMEIVVGQGDLFAEQAPLIVMGGWQGEALPAPLASLVPPGDWQGKPGQTVLLYTHGALPAPRVLLVGLGQRAGASAERVRVAAALAAQRARDLRLDSFAVAALGADAFGPEEAGQALAEGALLGAYRYLHFKSGLSDDERFEPSRMQVLDAEAPEALRQGVTAGVAIAQATNLARDLANGPGNTVTPAVLAETAQQLAGRYGMAATVLGPDELVAQSFGGLLAVAKGSAVEPRFIVLEYGRRGDGPTICLVGKGITFDTGGISIKPAASMEDMKFDMGGAAAVLGAMQAVGELKPALHVVGLVASCENMPSATAYKPGDIITTLSGTTIEVINTDAEGRIVLADALFYAQRYEPAAIIDLATLTGACVVALGHAAAGLVASDERLAERLRRAGDATGERAWPLPLYDDYNDQIKSTFADIKNTGGREGGALTAAAFLAHFVGDYPWAHLDIAGTAWQNSPNKAYQPKGATGYGVRLLLAALRSWGEGGPA